METGQGSAGAAADSKAGGTMPVPKGSGRGWMCFGHWHFSIQGHNSLMGEYSMRLPGEMEQDVTTQGSI